MKTVITGGFTPQRKNISVNDRFGNTGIKKQQGSTVIKYDTLSYTGQNELRFFEGSSQRNFQLSNTGSDGNKLGVGNSLVVERAYLSIIETVTATGAVTVTTIDAANAILQGAVKRGEFGFAIANSEVIKNMPILSWIPDFNKNANQEDYNNFEFDTQLVIPPLLEFVATLRLPDLTAALPAESTFQIRLTIEGAGAIIAPRTTF